MTNDLVQLRINACNMTRIFWILFLGPVGVYVLLNLYYSGLVSFWYDFTGMGLLDYIIAFVAMAVVHEALHVIAGLLAGARLSSFYFDFDRKDLSILCCCRDEMTVRGYRFFLLVPFLVLTPVFAGLYYVSESHLWWFMLAISTSGCCFDLTVFLGLLGVPGQTGSSPNWKGKTDTSICERHPGSARVVINLLYALQLGIK